MNVVEGTEGARAVVAPFFRASVAVAVSDRRLFARSLAASELEVRLRHAPEILRQNLRRLFAASVLAEAMAAPLVLAEGWRSNGVERARSSPRFVTGSWFFGAWVRVLRRRGLVSPRLRVIRRDISRCTWEEARAIIGIAEWQRAAVVIGVSDMPCPSAARARRYLRAGDVAITPSAALLRAGRTLAPAQLGFWRAVQPRGPEGLLAPLVEAPNWLVHGASEAARPFTAERWPLERRLAVALRRDRR